MKIAFVWYFDRASQIFPNWRDGLRAALEEIAKKHEVVYFLDRQVPTPNANFDAILFWGDSNCPFFSVVQNYSGKKGICLSTNPHNLDNLKKVDIVFCESDPVRTEARMWGIRTAKAFGTDTDFYTPDKSMSKDIDYFYPATFSPWKRQASIARYGNKLLCVGTLQPDGDGELAECYKMGVNVELGYFPAEKIRDYYRRARNVVIPAVHGSERTVLEAMACDILPVVNMDNKKAHSYISEYNDSECACPRDFVLKYYSHRLYAEKILKGLI